MCLSLFSSQQCIIKQLLDSVFVISNNQGLGKCYQPRPSARLITFTSALIVPDITKTKIRNKYATNIPVVVYRGIEGLWIYIRAIFV